MTWNYRVCEVDEDTGYGPMMAIRAVRYAVPGTDVGASIIDDDTTPMADDLRALGQMLDAMQRALTRPVFRPGVTA